MPTKKCQPEGKRMMPETRFTEKSQPEVKRVMPGNEINLVSGITRLPSGWDFSVWSEANDWLFFLPLSILFYPITLEGRRCTKDEFATIPFHLILFSAALVELAKSIPVHSLILSSHLFFCLPLFLFPFTVNCRIVFGKPEDLETWPNYGTPEGTFPFRYLSEKKLKQEN